MADTDLLSRARATRVVVVGGGVAGLAAARECARVGFAVTVLEAGDRLGGSVGSVDLDGIPVDIGADSYAPGAQELIDDLGLGADRVSPATEVAWITGLPSAAPLPRDTLAGIPANPWADDVRRVIGWRGAWRAYLDRLRPPLTIGRQASLGTLVESRMGDRVHDRLVAPLSRGLYGVDPAVVDVDAAVPGLSAALTRLGSLSGAVADLLVDRPDTTRRSLRGGMARLVDVLAGELDDLGALVITGARVDAIAAPAAGTEAGAPRRWTVEVAGAEPLEADVVIVATPGAVAHRLLSRAGLALPDAAAPHAAEPPVADVVTMLVEAPALDSAPRGAVVYPLSGSVSWVRHASAAWTWLADDLGPGRHVLRVQLAADESADDDRVVGAARAAASDALGVDLPITAVRAAHRARLDTAAPASVLGHAAARDAVRRAVAREPGLAVVGAWIAGAGIAATTRDAIAEADRVRRRVLWEHPSAPDVNPGKR